MRILLVLAVLATPASASLPPGAYGWMAELAGSCWAAAYADGTRDTQCYSSQYDRYLRGTIELVPPAGSGRPPYRGDSVAFWDAERSEIAVHYWSDAGNRGVMTGRVERGQLVFMGRARGEEPPATRTVWTRIDADTFRVIQQRRTGEAWTDALSLVYRRGPPAP
jgi:hypothetical protein